MVNRNEKPNNEATPKRKSRGLFGRLFWCVQWLVNLLVLAALVLILTPASDWLDERLIDVDPPAKADYIVVLGGSHDRAVEAARLYREGWAGKVIFSVHESGAEVYTEVAEAYGLPGEVILLDRQPSRTADHPRTIAQLPGIDKQNDRFMIVTSPYHTRRARAVFLKAGYGNVMMRSPDWRVGGRFEQTPGGWLLRSCITRARRLPEQAYEVLAWGVYRLRGWV